MADKSAPVKNSQEKWYGGLVDKNSLERGMVGRS